MFSFGHCQLLHHKVGIWEGCLSPASAHLARALRAGAGRP
jgi:hypothetical protein